MNIWSDWVVSAIILSSVVALVLVAHFAFFWFGRRWLGRRPGRIVSSLIEKGYWPARAILVLGALVLALPTIPLEGEAIGVIRHALGLGQIAAIAWLLITLIDVVDDVTATRFDIEIEDNLLARRVRTQVRVLRQVATVIVVVIALAVMLMTFPEVRRIGEGLFASAGIAAIIVGIAAQPALANLIAGLQLAMTEPIRIDDVVIVEGEWGRVEEIGPTYVVVRIWDLRRLIVPLSYFIEQPFQNWTRQTADLIGSVYLYTDYRVPVDAVRKELNRILETSDLWDGEVGALQVTNASERTIELRALMSARNSGDAWNLRCDVRERLIAFLSEHYPDSLPRTRAEIDDAPGGSRVREWAERSSTAARS